MEATLIMATLSNILFLLQLVYHIVLSINTINSSFNTIPKEVEENIYSFVSDDDHYKIRRLTKESNKLFIRMHPNKSNEKKQWYKLKHFMSTLSTSSLMSYNTEEVIHGNIN